MGRSFWRGLFFAGGFAATCAAGPATAQTWETVGRPSSGPPQVFGGAANGCIAGAVQLPLEGRGYQAVRVSRNRYWGHPDTVEFVVDLAAQLAQRGFPAIYVGDMGQPRGGRMPYGHASHQNGLDVDIWFNLRPKAPLPAAQREVIETPLLVRRDRTIDYGEFDRRHVEMLRIAATQPRVERIFVNFAIKRELCNIVTGDRRWLQRIRPWYGHDEHFHVRMACPAGSPGCVRQPALPPGDGCDELESWFRPPPPQVAVATRVRPRPRPPAPPQCAAVLRGIVPASLAR
ncbi:MAG: penicillin-insensitive murein endopeptidase [Alphaproteobacteria bacterium]|nr:penicillin-insensitive murein endopeptidase [Alphaproteobacteria bacterium]